MKIPAPVTEDDSSLNALLSEAKGGRPKGTTILLKQHLKESVITTKNEITCMYQEKKREYIKKGEKIPDGWLKETINNIRSIRGLPPSVRIPMSTIRNCTKSIVMQESDSETLYGTNRTTLS